MTEAQVWAVIGVLAASFIGTITVTTQLMMRTISAQIGGPRNEMTARFEKVDVRFAEVDRRLDRIENRFDGLDRDVQAIARKVFPHEES